MGHTIATRIEIRELTVKKFQHKFSVVTDRVVYLKEAMTIRDPSVLNLWNYKEFNLK